jgi:L-threonylcarbamoyladenylate synthase
MGRLVAFPTDTVYGLGALVANAAGIARIYAAKERPPEKAIPVLIADIDTARTWVGQLPAAAEALANSFWPGALTLVVPCDGRIPTYITSDSNSVAVRIPRHPITLKLLSELGEPLAVTSANRSGDASTLTAQDVLDQLTGRIDAVLDGGRCPGGSPSTVLSLTTHPPRILREGPIPVERLQDVLDLAGFDIRIVN